MALASREALKHFERYLKEKNEDSGKKRRNFVETLMSVMKENVNSSEVLLDCVAK